MAEVYIKMNWNKTNTYVSVHNLNIMDKGIKDNNDAIISIEDMISDSYSQKTYAVGDYCIHNDAMYKCSTAITTAEEWNISHWTATDIATEIKAANTNFNTINTNFNTKLGCTIYSLSSFMSKNNLTSENLTSMTTSDVFALMQDNSILYIRYNPVTNKLVDFINSYSTARLTRMGTDRALVEIITTDSLAKYYVKHGTVTNIVAKSYALITGTEVVSPTA